MTRNNDDIESLIAELDHIQVNMDDPSLGSSFWAEAMRDFMRRHSGDLITLLKELEVLRERQDRQNHPKISYEIDIDDA